MFGDTFDLAENKLLLLHIFSELDFPISNIKLTEIILQNNLMNYFTLQQYINELISSQLLTVKIDEDKERLLLSKNGKMVLDMFNNRISSEKVAMINAYLTKNKSQIKKEISVSSDYTLEGKENFIVDLKVSENSATLMELKFLVATQKQAREICSQWKENSSELYPKIIKMFIQD